MTQIIKQLYIYFINYIFIILLVWDGLGLFLGCENAYFSLLFILFGYNLDYFVINTNTTIKGIIKLYLMIGTMKHLETLKQKLRVD